MAIGHFRNKVLTVAFLIGLSFEDGAHSLLRSGEQNQGPSNTQPRNLAACVASSPTLDEIIQNGKLKCGIMGDVPGFAMIDPSTGEYSGMDVDICRAVAAAALGDASLVDFVELSEAERFPALHDGRAHMLAAGTTHTMERDVNEPNTQKGHTFSVPYFYDGAMIAGTFESGSEMFSKNPIALVTKQDDPAWSDFVNWVLQSLMNAEEMGITMATASGGDFIQTDSFGEQFQDAYINALNAVGNYGEIYERNLESIVPRANTLNLINQGDSGLHYAIPFGNVGNDGPERGFGTLSKIKSRGYFRCGTSQQAGFGMYDVRDSEWSGFDVDFCRAVAAAIFGDPTKVVFIELNSARRFVTLASGSVDVLSRVTTHNLQRDVCELDAGTGFTFSTPVFYDGMVYGGENPTYLKCAESSDSTSADCAGLKICVQPSSTYETEAKKRFDEAIIMTTDYSGIFAAYDKKMCNVIGDGFTGYLFQAVKSNPNFVMGSTIISKDPLALVTRQDDPQFSDFVYWVVQAIIFAEEEGITQSTAADLMPQTKLFGPSYTNMLRNAVSAVGNYGEIYARYSGLPQREGLNTQSTQADGLLYPLPM